MCDCKTWPIFLLVPGSGSRLEFHDFLRENISKMKIVRFFEALAPSQKMSGLVLSIYFEKLLIQTMKID